MKHSNSALQAIFLRELTELPSGDLWLPGLANGFTLTLQPCGLYHLRRIYNRGGQSKVLCCGTYEETSKWIRQFLHFCERGNIREQTNMRNSFPCKCTWVAYQKGK
jgi:hypothetical protein